MTTTQERSDFPDLPAPEYGAMRTELLSLIERLSSDNWTDYNTHDPGITLGELLTWGIAEDGYVAHHPLADLLTLAEGTTYPPHADFPPEQVLPCRALTLLDFRKLIIDVPGVRNAWLQEVRDPEARVWLERAAAELRHDPPIPADATEIVLRGFYKVDVALEDDVDAATVPGLLAEIRTLLEGNRNLCEIFLRIDAIPAEDIAVCADVTVTPEADLPGVMAGIAAALERFISPAPVFHTFADRLEAGLSADEILDGPLLRHGFLDDNDVLAAVRPENIRASDLIQVIMDVPGVIAVARMVMTGFRDGVASGDAQPWVLPLSPRRAPRLSIDRSRFTFYRRHLPFHVAPAEYARQLDSLRAERRFRRYPGGSHPPGAPLGRRRNLDSFETLLNLLPANYGAGPAGLPNNATAARKAQALQLKAFFLLAERLLAGHRAQLSHLREVLSLRRESPVLWSASPTRLRDFASLLETDEVSFASAQQRFTEDENARLARRQRIVDHFLARFGERFDSLAVAASRQPAGDTPATAYTSRCRWLGALPELAHDRMAAVDLTLPPGPPEIDGAISGLEARLYTLLGLPRALPAGALAVTEDADGAHFTLTEPSGPAHLAEPAPLATTLEAAGLASAAVRSAPYPERYRIEPSGEEFRLQLTDECGETVARSPSAFASAELAGNARQACVAWIRGLPMDPPLQLLEHIHLRPLHEGAELLPACDCPPESDPGCFGDDPYSFRVTLALPAWPARFNNLFYRAHLETVARELTPAHVFLKICWLNEPQMTAFTAALHAWRAAHAALLAGAGPDPASARDELVRVWRGLRSVFPAATLHDCVDGDDDNPVVLDHNTLGTLLEDDT